MKHSEFTIGGTFWCGEGKWRCTDIGTRAIVAMRIDRIEVVTSAPGAQPARRTLNQHEAEAEGWFSGPPYASDESAFDEYDIQGCTPEAD